jgi:hypothetical protein
MGISVVAVGAGGLLVLLIVAGCVHQRLKLDQGGPRQSQALLASGSARESFTYTGV